MAKKINRYNSIASAQDLVTPREQTRAGFIAMALEKNYLALPYIIEAKTLKAIAQIATSPSGLLRLTEIRAGLLTASGLSEKSLKYLTEEDKTVAIQGLIEKFLEPEGSSFVDELVYRYLLIKGDALGGKARNLAGSLGERKFLGTLLSVLRLAGTTYQWRDSETSTWQEKATNEVDLEKRISGLHWHNQSNPRLLLMNVTVPVLKKNVDLCILEATPADLKKGLSSILHSSKSFLALGELKGGIDPAGADEHWKTANSALVRIRTGFGKVDHRPATFFIGAAIERSMADEIYTELQTGVLTKAANLTNDIQLAEICSWLVTL